MEPLSPPDGDAEHPRPSHPVVVPGKEPAGWVMLWRWDWGVGGGDQINEAALHRTLAGASLVLAGRCCTASLAAPLVPDLHWDPSMTR